MISVVSHRLVISAIYMSPLNPYKYLDITKLCECLLYYVEPSGTDTLLIQQYSIIRAYQVPGSCMKLGLFIRTPDDKLTLRWPRGFTPSSTVTKSTV